MFISIERYIHNQYHLVYIKRSTTVFHMLISKMHVMKVIFESLFSSIITWCKSFSMFPCYLNRFVICNTDTVRSIFCSNEERLISVTHFEPIQQYSFFIFAPHKYSNKTSWKVIIMSNWSRFLYNLNLYFYINSYFY